MRNRIISVIFYLFCIGSLTALILGIIVGFLSLFEKFQKDLDKDYIEKVKRLFEN